jgi:hypothetical protein
MSQLAFKVNLQEFPREICFTVMKGKPVSLFKNLYALTVIEGNHGNKHSESESNTSNTSTASKILPMSCFEISH